MPFVPDRNNGLAVASLVAGCLLPLMAAADGLTIDYNGQRLFLQGPEFGQVIDPAGNMVTFGAGESGAMASVVDPQSWAARIAGAAPFAEAVPGADGTVAYAIPINRWCGDSCVTVYSTTVPDPPEPDQPVWPVTTGPAPAQPDCNPPPPICAIYPASEHCPCRM